MRPAPMFTAILIAIGVGACAEQPSAPDTSSRPELAVSNSAVKFWNELASVQWNERATALLAGQVSDAVRVYSYLHFAQYRAAREAAAGNGPHPPVSAAIGAASAAVLNSFFPSQVARIEAALDSQEVAARWPGAKHADFAAGEAIGRAVAAEVLAWARTDGVGLTAPPPPLVGPGYWVATGGVMARGNLGARPFFLDSGDEFRPPPPPAFGSAAFNAARDEVRLISDTRTPEQAAIAVFWHINQSPRSNSVMNATARELIVAHHRNDAEAARILFLANASSFDALIGCFDAKYHYWLLRPTMADPAITLPAGMTLPPHPSYPSAHSCISGAFTASLIKAFPNERARLEALATEAGMSRVYGGIHYRFDSETGIQLGTNVARKAWLADLDAIDITP